MNKQDENNGEAVEFADAQAQPEYVEHGQGEQHQHEEFQPAPELEEQPAYEQHYDAPVEPEAVMQEQFGQREFAAQPEPLATKQRGFLGRAWHGEEKLWKVFWLYGVLLGGALNIVLTVLLLPVLLASLMVPFLALLPAVLLAPYTVWILVSQWRCAWNVKAKFWGYVVRILVVISVLAWVYSLVNMVISPAQTTPKVVATSATLTPTAAPEGGVAAEQTPALPSTDTPVAAMDACEQRMTDYAVENGADPKAYIAENQAWLAQCKEQDAAAAAH